MFQPQNQWVFVSNRMVNGFNSSLQNIIPVEQLLRIYCREVTLL